MSCMHNLFQYLLTYIDSTREEEKSKYNAVTAINISDVPVFPVFNHVFVVPSITVLYHYFFSRKSCRIIQEEVHVHAAEEGGRRCDQKACLPVDFVFVPEGFSTEVPLIHANC
jgi:hypothetical protein